MARNRSNNRWYVSKGHPPFEAGDRITPKSGGYSYDNAQHRWPHGEYRTVKAVTTDEDGKFYTLTVWNPVAGRNSNYTPNNFEKQDTKTMAPYERTKYIGVKATDDGDIPYKEDCEFTEWRNSQHEVRCDIAKTIGAGDKWLVLQTVCLIEGEEPRPPIRVTEYR